MASDWQTETRTCKLSTCGIQFKPQTYKQEYHTRNCRRIALLRPQSEKKCAYVPCGTIFMPKTSRGKFCSHRCKYIFNLPNTYASLKRSRERNRNGGERIYMTDEKFKEIVKSKRVLKCTQTVCVTGCVIRHNEHLGCYL